MKKTSFLMTLIALGLTTGLLSACNRQISVDEEGGVTTKQDTLIVEETTYEKDQTKFVFRKNRVNKTAEVAMTHAVTDSDEFSEFMGEQVTTAPFLINMFCSIMNQAFYDPDSLATATDSADTSVGSEFKNDSELKQNLAEYTVTNYQLNFVDAETQEPIASCQATEKGFENIKFDVQRDYSGYGSFFGMEIGKVE